MWGGPSLLESQAGNSKIYSMAARVLRFEGYGGGYMDGWNTGRFAMRALEWHGYHQCLANTHQSGVSGVYLDDLAGSDPMAGDHSGDEHTSPKNHGALRKS